MNHEITSKPVTLILRSDFLKCQKRLTSQKVYTECIISQGEYAVKSSAPIYPPVLYGITDQFGSICTRAELKQYSDVSSAVALGSVPVWREAVCGWYNWQQERERATALPAD